MSLLRSCGIVWAWRGYKYFAPTELTISNGERFYKHSAPLELARLRWHASGLFLNHGLRAALSHFA